MAMAPSTPSAEAFSIGVTDNINPVSRPAHNHARGIPSPIRPAPGNVPKHSLMSRYHLFMSTSTQPTHNLRLWWRGHCAAVITRMKAPDPTSGCFRSPDHRRIGDPGNVPVQRQLSKCQRQRVEAQGTRLKWQFFWDNREAAGRQQPWLRAILRSKARSMLTRLSWVQVLSGSPPRFAFARPVGR